MASSAAVSRMAKEIRMLQTDPPPGVWAAPVGDSATQLEAQLQGPKDTVYQGGLFKLSVDIPARYPFEPPKVKFVTPIYHPNIDPEGRICLDILNMPPKGAWKPSLNVPTVLASVGLLLAEPNPDDGLVTDVTAEFRHQRAVFDAKARQWTQRHAVQGACGGGDQAVADVAPAQAQQAPRQQEPQRQQQQEQRASQAEGQRSEAAGSKENGRPAGAVEPAGSAGKHPAAGREPLQQQPKRARLALRK